MDGGGIRGVFPAAVLAGLERRYTGGRSIASYFDLVAGTSTGGILALGLGAGYTASELLNLYVTRGCEVFPPFTDNALGRLKAWIRDKKHYANYLYNRAALERLLADRLGDRPRAIEPSTSLALPRASRVDISPKLPSLTWGRKFAYAVAPEFTLSHEALPTFSDEHVKAR